MRWPMRPSAVLLGAAEALRTQPMPLRAAISAWRAAAVPPAWHHFEVPPLFCTRARGGPVSTVIVFGGLAARLQLCPELDDGVLVFQPDLKRARLQKRVDIAR